MKKTNRWLIGLVVLIFLFIIEVYFYDIDKKFIYLFTQKGKLQGIYYFLSVFVSNIVIVILFFVRKNIIFLIGIFFIILMFSIDIGYYLINKTPFGFSDMVIVFANPTYIVEAVKTYSGTIISVSIFSLAIILGLYFLRKKLIKNNIFFIHTKYFIGVLAINFVISFYMVKKTANSTFNPIAFTNIPNNIVYFIVNRLYYGERNKLILKPKNISQYRNIIFILDESISGKYLSLNEYKINTTPFLKHLEKDRVLTNLGIGKSGWNCSAPSNIILMSLANTSEIPDIGGGIY